MQVKSSNEICCKTTIQINNFKQHIMQVNKLSIQQNRSLKSNQQKSAIFYLLG